jgi:hypothetical protein
MEESIVFAMMKPSPVGIEGLFDLQFEKGRIKIKYSEATSADFQSRGNMNRFDSFDWFKN